jgi:alkaline phosphatase D
MSEKQQFISNWNSPEPRIWIGPDYWTNPLQDWQVYQGRLSCTTAGPGRSVHLLTMALEKETGNFETTVTIGLPAETAKKANRGWSGFIIGAKGEFDDYRSAAVYGKGINAGITTKGNIFIGSMPAGPDPEEIETEEDLNSDQGVTLRLVAKQEAEGNYKISLTLMKTGSGRVLSEVTSTAMGDELFGNIALVSDLEGGPGSLSHMQGFWFKEWSASGNKLTRHEERAFGPVLFTMYTLSKNTLKLTAQMPPLAADDSKRVTLEIMGEENTYEKAAEAEIDTMSRTATFRFENWNKGTDIPYRVLYSWSPDSKKPSDWSYSGTIRHDPVDKELITVAAFTGNNDLGFPNNEITDHVLKQDPDLLVFTGDQIYEPVGGFGYTIEPLDKATLDYLRKWYMFGWEYGSMLKNIPSVSIPDDHDVYHGNLWGCGGKAARRSEDVKEWQDDGGYKLPPEWVNMVQRTQTSHLPDPYDPSPVLQNISVYYTDLHVGGISFAVIEDRKWKSAPKAFFPASFKVINGWAESSRLLKPELLDVPAELLGKRQLDFLEEWAGDWSDRTIMKAVISQTLFCTVATLPDSAQSDVVVSKLRITRKGEYPPDDLPTQDMDSNGWPKRGRDEALRVIRKAYAVHIAGDQHLASTVRYGIETWGDSPYAICVPSISNYFPRRWFPKEAGKNRIPGHPKNTGDFFDGFGNRITVLAVANPVVTGLTPSRLYDRAAGYGIIKFNKNTREIELANWPRQTDPSLDGAKPYEGWPLAFKQEDNYSRNALEWLPTLRVTGLTLPPVVKVFREDTGELVYAIRSETNTFRPKVFERGSYKMEVGEPGTDKWKVLNNVNSRKPGDTSTIDINF